MKVELLKQVGDNPKGTVLDIKDKSLLKKWAELQVIESKEDFEDEELNQEDLQDNANDLDEKVIESKEEKPKKEPKK